MPYDESVADRVRKVIRAVDGIEERRMFGGLAFLAGGHMFCGVLGNRLVLRLGDDAARDALARADTAPMDFTGRPLKSMVYVDPPGFAAEEELRRWIELALGFARGLPPKPRGGRSPA